MGTLGDEHQHARVLGMVCALQLATPRRAKWAARSSKAKIKRTFIYRNVKYYSLFGLGLTCGTRMVG
jgi:hypothetical protein